MITAMTRKSPVSEKEHVHPAESWRHVVLIVAVGLVLLFLCFLLFRFLEMIN
jgi:hypothetical protein